MLGASIFMGLGGGKGCGRMEPGMRPDQSPFQIPARRVKSFQMSTEGFHKMAMILRIQGHSHSHFLRTLENLAGRSWCQRWTPRDG